MAIPDYWYNWDSMTFNGPATTWYHLDTYWSGIQWTNYWMATKSPRIHANTFIAIHLLQEKCNAMQSQIDALSGPAEVTMGAILDVMLTAEYGQLQEFVAIVDAYRVTIWDEWFNVEYYASLARRFKYM